MSDAGSINTKPNQSLSARESGQASAPNLEIISLPKSIENVDRTQKLRGEVISVERDGIIHIRTDKGEITAKLAAGIQIAQGDKVEITIQLKVIDSEQIQIANIRVAVKQPATSETLPKDYTDLKPAINTPPTLTPLGLVNGAPVKVTALTPQDIPKITIPYIENIDVNLGLVSKKSILVTAQLPVENIILSHKQNIISDVDILNIAQVTNAPLILSLPQQVSLELVAPDLNKVNIGDVFTLQAPTTKIPLNIVIAQIISNPQPQAIVINSDEALRIVASNFSPAIISEVNISNIAPPLPEIVPINTEIQQIDTKTFADNQKSGELKAVLVGFTEDKNLPILRIITPETATAQHYALQANVEDIAIGSQIKLEVTQSTNIIGLADSSIEHAQALTSHTQFIGSNTNIWPILQEISQALMTANPQVAQAFTNTLPNASMPHQIGASALFFLAAMRGGDMQSWLGERAVEILKMTGKGELITRLGTEISSLARTSNDPISQEWRMLTMPLTWQDDIHKVTMHYRKEHDSGSDDNGQNSGSKTRFVMDLNLSQIGKVQLDGLFIGNHEGVGRLDLILRTEQGFSEAIKMEMRGSYKNALDQTQFTGELSFQGQKDSWVNITPDNTGEFARDV